MGLTTSLGNAVTGLRINQESLDILSRNVANAGTPGYHRQSLNVVDYNAQNSTYARSEGVNRAFNNSLQTYYTRQVSDTANSAVQANYLDRLQGFMGKPGSPGSVDTLLTNLRNRLQGISTSPDDYNARAEAVTAAQEMAETLNRLSSTIQTMRQEAEGQIANNVHNLNGMLNSLSEVNYRMLDLGMSDSARAALQDQRDRLVSGISEMVDVQADYRANGTVALMTRSGVGLLDGGVSVFSFDTAGNLSPNSQFNPDETKTKVGQLKLTTPSGLAIDLVSQGILQGGEIGGLINLRDRTLVEAQEQLDEIAAGLAMAFSTNQSAGTTVVDGAAEGLEIDLSNMQPGNDVILTYSVDGVEKRVRLLNTTTPSNYVDATGQQVIGIDMSQGTGDLANRLDAMFPNLTFRDGGANKLQIFDDGAVGHTDVRTAVARSTASGTQGGGLGFNLFTDQGGKPFTNNLDTDPPQKQGFAARISINPLVVADNRLMVQYELGNTLGDADRANYVIGQLDKMTFVSGGDPKASGGRFQLTGNLSEIVSQVVGFQGSTINAAMTKYDDRQLTLDTLVEQMNTEYGVNVDEEMARLMELQNAYAANARIVSVVSELLDALMNTVR